MKKTTFNCVLVLASIISVSVLASTTLASDKISEGVKKGYWIEYNISITGPPLDPIRNLTWYRNEILEVNGAAFEANMTALTVNGTYSNSVWHFNLTEGQVQGWEIIPPNLDVGDTFFDSAKSANITVEGEEQKIVAGATRTVTHGNDPGKLYKEWDKATGVYVNSVEHTKNYLVLTNATATNMWNPEIQEPNQTVFYAVVAACAVLAAGTSLVTIFARGKTRKWPTLRSPSQGKTVALTILAVVLAEVGFINFFPFYQVGLSFAQINLVMQTIWTGLVFVSLRLRTKGNYFAHEITMLTVVTAWAVGLVMVLFMDPFSSSTAVFSNTPLRLIMNGLHGIFSIPALVFGVWLVLLWRPGSTTFAPKSRRLAQVLPVFWVVSYVVGVLDFMLLHTAFLG